MSADVIGIRAARNGGNTPPATPIRTASPIPTTSDVPLIRKANPISAKLVPMAAEVMPSAGRTGADHHLDCGRSSHVRHPHPFDASPHALG